MRKEMMSIVGVMAIAALILVAFQYQANAQSQQNDEIAVIGLFEQATSGYSGIATLRSSADQQQDDQLEEDIEGRVYAVKGMVETGIEELLVGAYVLLVFEHDLETPKLSRRPLPAESCILSSG